MLPISTKLIAATARSITFSCRRAIATSGVYRTPPQKEVPVTTFSKSDKSKTTLKVNINGLASKHGQAGELNRKAERFSVGRLTPTMRSFTLEGKVALVTGGARGLGWNMAQALAEAGAQSIALLDIREDLGNSAAAELHETTGLPIQFYAVDVTDEHSVAEAVNRAHKDLGAIDIVVNSAGIADSKIKAESYPPPRFRHVMDINLTGSFLVSQACSRHMIAAGAGAGRGGGRGGSIIFVSSIAGSRVLHPQQQCAYNASKAAVTQLAKSLASEWAPHGIRCNVIAPGYMDTALNREALLEGEMQHWRSMTPMGRMGKPEELNGVCVFLASEASGFVTGSHIYVDGGYACY